MRGDSRVTSLVASSFHASKPLEKLRKTIFEVLVVGKSGSLAERILQMYRRSNQFVDALSTFVNSTQDFSGGCWRYGSRSCGIRDDMAFWFLGLYLE